VCVCGCRKLGSLYVCPEDKWRAVFEECWSRLGCEAAGRGENRKAWENIAVALTTSRQHIADRYTHTHTHTCVLLAVVHFKGTWKCFPPSPETLSLSHSRTLESLEVVPTHEGPITMERYHATRLYLLMVRPHPHGAQPEPKAAIGTSGL